MYQFNGSHTVHVRPFRSVHNEVTLYFKVFCSIFFSVWQKKKKIEEASVILCKISIKLI